MEKIEVKLFILELCPFCIKVRRYLDEVLQDPKYERISIRLIDERKERQEAYAHDYYLVPTFYLKDEKILEGRMTKEDVIRVLDTIIEKAS